MNLSGKTSYMIQSPLSPPRSPSGDQLKDLSAARIRELTERLAATEKEQNEWKDRYNFMKSEYLEKENSLNATIAELSHRLADAEKGSADLIGRCEEQEAKNQTTQSATSAAIQKLEEEVAQLTGRNAQLQDENVTLRAWTETDAFPAHRLELLFQSLAAGQVTIGQLRSAEAVLQRRLDTTAQALAMGVSGLTSFGSALNAMIDTYNLSVHQRRDLTKSVQELRAHFIETQAALDAPIPETKAPTADARLQELSARLAHADLGADISSKPQTPNQEPKTVPAPVAASPYRRMVRNSEGVSMGSALGVLDDLISSKQRYDGCME